MLGIGSYFLVLSLTPVIYSAKRNHEEREGFLIRETFIPSRNVSVFDVTALKNNDTFLTVNQTDEDTPIPDTKFELPGN